MSDWILNEDGKYADLEYTNFPASCDNWTNSEDISSSLIGAANQYRAAMENGNYTNASCTEFKSSSSKCIDQCRYYQSLEAFYYGCRANVHKYDRVVY